MAAVRIFISKCCCFEWTCSDIIVRLTGFLVSAEVQHEMAVFEHDIRRMRLAADVVSGKINAPSKTIPNTSPLADRLI